MYRIVPVARSLGAAQRRKVPHAFVPAANNRSKGTIGRIADDEVKLNYWRLIFLQSRANGCFYGFEALPHFNWRWPKNTWFQERLSHHLKVREMAAHDARN